MFAQERQKIILDKLVQQNSITIKELATSLNVSEATLRTDLTKLEQQNLLRRTHGGAILVDTDEHETSFSTRQLKNKTEKMRLHVQLCKRFQIINLSCLMPVQLLWN